MVDLAMLAKYQPQDTTMKVELRQMLNAIKMKKNNDPATIFEQISRIKNKYYTPGKTIDEEDLIAVGLDVAMPEYQAILTLEQQFKGATLKLQHLESAMTQHYCQMNSK